MKESHLFPTWWANPQKTSETSVLAIVRLRRTESTTLAMKESHREVIRGNVQKQAKVANITARHWQRKTHNTQAFKPAVCHPRAARRTLRESKPLCATPGLQDAPSGYRTWVHRPKAYSIPLCHGGLPSDWAWKGFAGIKNTMRNTPLTPQPNPQPNPQTTPQLMKLPQITLPNPLVVASSSRKALATIKSHFSPSSWYKKPLKPRCLAIARLQPTESAAFAMKERHRFPTWWANPQKTSETSVFGNSVAST